MQGRAGCVAALLRAAARILSLKRCVYLCAVLQPILGSFGCFLVSYCTLARLQSVLAETRCKSTGFGAGSVITSLHAHSDRCAATPAFAGA